MGNDTRGGNIAIGVDVGGTKILGVVANSVTGEVAHRVQIPTPDGAGASSDPNTSAGARLGQAIGDVVQHLEGLAGDGPNPTPVGVGVGLPGLVDRSGVLRYGPNVAGVYDLDVGGVLATRTNLPVFADNDAAHAAVAEHRLGAAVGHDDALIITQGTGIGAAFILGGRLHRGAHGFAGEPGHMKTEQNGHRCACGRFGCWETVSSGAGLRNLAQGLIAEGGGAGIVARADGDRDAIRGEHVAEALHAGDPDAAEVLRRFAVRVASGIGSLISLLDPSIVVLGGGLSAIQDEFLAEVADLVPRHTVGGSFRPIVPIVPAIMGPEAGAIGGAIVAAEGS